MVPKALAHHAGPEVVVTAPPLHAAASTHLPPEAVGAAGWCGVEAQTGGANHHDSYYACQSVPAGGFAVATCLALATAYRGLYAANTSAAA